MTGGKRKIRFESYLEVVRGLMQILEDEKTEFCIAGGNL